MKKILALLIGFLMIANVTFAMAGFIEMQTINGVRCGMSPDEVVEKWGQPIAQESESEFYFNPGGLCGRFNRNMKNGIIYMEFINAKGNPQLVLKPSGVTIGMSKEKVIQILGKPDSIQYMAWPDNSSGMCDRLIYNMPEYTNYANLKGTQTLSIWVSSDSSKPDYNQVVSIWLRSLWGFN